MDFQNRLSHGEMFNADSIAFADSLQYKTINNGRTVFGGGGIMPDIFIPMDTSSHYQYYNRLRRNNIVYNFVLDFVDSNREKLKKKFTQFDEFNKNFEVTSEMINQIVANGEKEKIEKDEESLAFTKKSMIREIKALIARDLYSRNDFYKIFYQDDEAILKALEVIENQEEYNILLVSSE